jgi:CHASE2 domain-containing sensor protein
VGRSVGASLQLLPDYLVIPLIDRLRFYGLSIHAQYNGTATFSF